ncbi:MAG: poly-gamma-glutamate synthase PgsB [Candidatus Marinimicrobia bacterium]|nr:poly-gamma-glutamate synthase PgsB [Candidatus Neomarinimicrobiota bacterium]
MMPLYLLGALAMSLCIAGLIEFQLHNRSLSSIPLRIHVNGTRGKSSVTRLVAAGLREGGLKTFAKTTGTAPRVIDPEGKDRIIHRLRLPSIGEQVRLLRYFASEKPDAVVIECMAVQPQYQWIAEHQMIKSHIGVITNVRPDHLEEMGPTEEDVAYSLCNTIPNEALLITAEDQKLDILKAVAKQNNSQVVCSDPTSISQKEIDLFTYIEHRSNVAIAIDVCEKAGIDRQTALNGMHKVKPDVGALVVWDLMIKESTYKFVNGMAANDPVSTLGIWNSINDRYGLGKKTCIFFNSREDRPRRTAQMIELTLSKIKPNFFIIRGDKVLKIINDLVYLSPLTIIKTFDLNKKLTKATELLESLPNETLIYAIGNQVGAGQEILEKISKLKING